MLSASLWFFGLTYSLFVLYVGIKWYAVPHYRRFLYGLTARRLLSAFEGVTSQRKKALETLLDRWVEMKATRSLTEKLKGDTFNGPKPDIRQLEGRISRLMNELLYEDVDEGLALAEEGEAKVDNLLESDFNDRLTEAQSQEESDTTVVSFDLPDDVNKEVLEEVCEELQDETIDALQSVIEDDPESNVKNKAMDKMAEDPYPDEKYKPKELIERVYAEY